MIPNAAPTEVESSGPALLDLWVKTRRFQQHVLPTKLLVMIFYHIKITKQTTTQKLHQANPVTIKTTTAKSKANKPTPKEYHQKYNLFFPFTQLKVGMEEQTDLSPSIDLAQLLLSAGHEFPALNPPKTQLEAMQSHRGCGEIPPKIHPKKQKKRGDFRSFFLTGPLKKLNDNLFL